MFKKIAIVCLAFWFIGCSGTQSVTTNQIKELACESLSINFKLKKVEVVSTDSDKFPLKLRLFGENYYYVCYLESEITKDGKTSNVETFLNDFNKSKRLGKCIYVTLSDPSIAHYNKIDYIDLK